METIELLNKMRLAIIGQHLNINTWKQIANNIFHVDKTKDVQIRNGLDVKAYKIIEATDQQHCRADPK